MAKRTCVKCSTGEGKRHNSTVARPSDATLERWSNDGGMRATDGCAPVEDDGRCEHGHQSWMLALGLI